MKIIILFFLINLSCIAQRTGKYKINFIDSTSFKYYYILKIIDSNKDTLVVFSEKTSSIKGHLIKINKKYKLTLTKINDIKLEDMTMRLGRGIVLNNNEVLLKPMEAAYKSECLIGINYVKCK
jgi:hypothetical protein